MSKKISFNAKVLSGVFDNVSGTLAGIVIQKNGRIRAGASAKKKPRKR